MISNVPSVTMQIDRQKWSFDPIDRFDILSIKHDSSLSTPNSAHIGFQSTEIEEYVPLIEIHVCSIDQIVMMEVAQRGRYWAGMFNLKSARVHLRSLEWLWRSFSVCDHIFESVYHSEQVHLFSPRQARLYHTTLKKGFRWAESFQTKGMVLDDQRLFTGRWWVHGVLQKFSALLVLLLTVWVLSSSRRWPKG